ncbi:hypothetical protein, partial [Fibrobacter sp.]|uniref:hypothetical protein n=1 Tax=Fibrobacter sp. TaxID=35828 RepID=UPI0039C72011
GAIRYSGRGLVPYRFNSRTREGCDTTIQVKKRRVRFQFTHPRGGRGLLGEYRHYSSCFNSRTREGCDGTI